MESPEHADGQAANPDAEPLGAGVLCYQCTYDLVGRVPGEPCPECGLDVAASWPAWDLRACHRVYVEHVRTELGALLGAVVFFALAGLCGTWVAWLAGLPGRHDAKMMAFFGVGAATIILLGAAVGQLFKLVQALDKHPQKDAAPGRVHRRRMRHGTIAIGAGMFVGLTLAIIAFGLATALGVTVALAGALLLLAGVGQIYLHGLAYAGLTLDRAGTTSRFGRLEEAAGLLPLAAVALLPIAALGLMPWAWVAAAALAGVTLGAAGLALRCVRARGVLRRLIVEPA